MLSGNGATLAVGFFPMMLMCSMVVGRVEKKQMKRKRRNLRRPAKPSSSPLQPQPQSDDNQSGPARFSNSVQTSSRLQDENWEEESMLALFHRSCSFGIIDLRLLLPLIWGQGVGVLNLRHFIEL